MTIDAIGYVRSDISGIRRSWDEQQIRSLAKRLGYNLRKTIVFSAHTDRPDCRLEIVVDRLDGIEAVITPSAHHFADGMVPATLVGKLDVITVDDEHTYARWPNGQLPSEMTAR